MPALSPRTTLLVLSLITASIAGCGSSSSSTGASNSGSSSSGGATTTLGVSQLELAQTHVLPAEGLTWTLPNASETLHFTGLRDTLALIKLAQADATNPVLEGWLNGVKLGSLVLSAPAQLAPTESSGPAYATDKYSALIPAAWLQSGLQLRVSADNYLAGTNYTLKIGADAEMTVWTLPFYLFGANDSNSATLAVTAQPNPATISEMKAKWPVSRLNVQNHSLGKINWPYIVIGPSDSGTAYVVRNKDEQRSGYAIMGAVLNVLGGLRVANGESALSVQYYAPLMMLNSSGSYSSPGGGLGGNSSGTGDHLYTGVFIHEQGHAFGISHQGEAYSSGRYPYVNGSLAGSTWGYDALRREFLAPFIPTTASSYSSCKSSRQLDPSGRCVKQDPMQGGAGDQAAGYKFATFSDYSTAMMQRYLESRIVPDATFASGYKRWNRADQKWDEAPTLTTSGGIWGLDQNLPIARNVPVNSIVITYSKAGTAGVSQIYPPMQHTGNLLHYIDPSQSADRADIVPDTSKYYWYCRNGGCDYTVRVTYANGTIRHVLLQNGFRPFNQARGTPPVSASDPLDSNSFRTWTINVPADFAILRIELLDTPMVWDGMPIVPVVLTSR